MEGNNSIIPSFVTWWYGDAYLRLFKYIKAVYIFTADLFSVRICFRTLFDPWKRDRISYEGLNLQQKFEVWTLNLASRFIGMVIKLMTVGSYFVFTIVITAVWGIVIFVWLIYPLVILYLIYRAITLGGS